MSMNEERKAVGQAIDATVKREQPAAIRFDPEQRNMLLQHYSGLAMQARFIAHPNALFDNRAADACVHYAAELVNALERHANLEAAKVQGNG